MEPDQDTSKNPKKLEKPSITETMILRRVTQELSYL